MGSHHRTLVQNVLGSWEVARPVRATGWLLRRRLERQCRRNLGHCWHPADAMIAWFCCGCGADEDGMPPQRCRICTEANHGA